MFSSFSSFHAFLLSCINEVFENCENLLNEFVFFKITCLSLFFILCFVCLFLQCSIYVSFVLSVNVHAPKHECDPHVEEDLREARQPKIVTRAGWKT